MATRGNLVDPDQVAQTDLTHWLIQDVVKGTPPPKKKLGISPNQQSVISSDPQLKSGGHGLTTCMLKITSDCVQLPMGFSQVLNQDIRIVEVCILII